MGQAASYAESSVQRALLRLKQEEQVDEDELLAACGYRRASYVARADTAAAYGTQRDADALPSLSSSSPLLTSCAVEAPLPPPPDSFGTLVSLTPEYYTLDELRDVLRYLPDPLWVSLYRVSLLYMLDNDHDSRINSTDISFFMDWGIKTVGRDVLPDQLAEVLQTYAALHCWHRCLHVGERMESERSAAAAAQQQQQQQGVAHNTGVNGANARARRRPMTSSGGIGGPGASGTAAHAPHHNGHHSQSVTSFMLLHFREAFLNAPAGGPVPLPSTLSIGPYAPTSDGSTASPASSSHIFGSPRPPPLPPSVTDAVRHAAAAHFAEWMLRLVQHQERDRRRERHRLERRLSSMKANAAGAAAAAAAATAAASTTTDVRLAGASWLRHSQYLTQQALRLRSPNAMLSTGAASVDAAGDADDVVVLSASPTASPERPLAGIAAATAAVLPSTSTPPLSSRPGAPPTPESAAVDAEVLTLSTGPLTASLSVSEGVLSNAATLRPAAVHSGTPPLTQPQPQQPGSPPLTGATPLRAPPALDARGTPTRSGGLDSASPAPPPPLSSFRATRGSGSTGDPPDARRRTAVTYTDPSSLSTHSPCPAQRLLAPEGGDGDGRGAGALPFLSTSPTKATPASAAAREEGAGTGGRGTAAPGVVHRSPPAHRAAAAASVEGDAEGSGLGCSNGWLGVSAQQVGVLLMDAEPFYAALEAGGWTTIGAAEEVYLDFAVEESYGVPFWSFCRLLNETSADEVQAALEMSTDHAVTVLTSAAAVEEYRRVAAVRQLQAQAAAHSNAQRHGQGAATSSTASTAAGAAAGGGEGSWACGLQVLPMFVVSEYTFVAFVAAFIHAYWTMLESMGVDPGTQPATAAESASAPVTRTASSGFPVQ